MNKEKSQQKKLIAALALIPAVWLPVYILWLGSMLGAFFDGVAVASSLVGLLMEGIILILFRQRRIKVLAIIGIICIVVLLLGALADISLRSSLTW